MAKLASRSRWASSSPSVAAMVEKVTFRSWPVSALVAGENSGGSNRSLSRRPGASRSPPRGLLSPYSAPAAPPRNPPPTPPNGAGGGPPPRRSAAARIPAPGGAGQIPPHHALEGARRCPPYQHRPAGKLPLHVGQSRNPLQNLGGTCSDVVGREHIGQALKPERADLSQHRALAGHRLTHHHIESADPVTSHDQQVLPTDLVDVTNLAPAKQRKRESALDQGGC